LTVIIRRIPSNRAQSTANLGAHELNYSNDVQIVNYIYFCGMVELLQTIEKRDDKLSTVMICGHNPTMEDTVRYLLRSPLPFEMPTLGMACFENHNPTWANFTNNFCRLRWLQIPRLKRKDL